MAVRRVALLALLASAHTAEGLRNCAFVHPARRSWSTGRSRVVMEFGEGFYRGYNYPAPNGPTEFGIRTLADDVFEVSLQRPLGLALEENEWKKGVTVIEVLEGSNAAKSPVPIQPGDSLVGTTAVILQGSKFERRMLDCRTWDYDRVISAIGSNEERFGCDDVVLQFQRDGSDAGVQSRARGGPE